MNDFLLLLTAVVLGYIAWMFVGVQVFIKVSGMPADDFITWLEDDPSDGIFTNTIILFWPLSVWWFR